MICCNWFSGRETPGNALAARERAGQSAKAKRGGKEHTTARRVVVGGIALRGVKVFPLFPLCPFAVFYCVSVCYFFSCAFTVRACCDYESITAFV